jgi:hypothetical protein
VYKSLLASLILVCSTAFAQASAPTEENKPYTYVPDLELEQVPLDNIKVVPKLAPDGAYKACDTLRGRGLIAISIADITIFVVIDCPEQIMKDI